MENAISLALGTTKALITASNPVNGLIFGGVVALTDYVITKDKEAFKRAMFSLAFDGLTLGLNIFIKVRTVLKYKEVIEKIKKGNYPFTVSFLKDLEVDLLHDGIRKVVDSKARQLAKDSFEKSVLKDLFFNSMNANDFLKGSIYTTIKHTKDYWKAFFPNFVTAVVLRRNPNGFMCGFLQSAMEKICEPILKRGNWLCTGCSAMKSIGLWFFFKGKREERYKS